ncbi:MAG TPA: DUF2262 domain-containing protein [Tepidisphaeraceae bacterium]|jgi:hypothetical protein|nr:DUF2262 domain-containing protein [Tepidisphaeraceae bacterium]
MPEFHAVLGRLVHDEDRNIYTGKLTVRQQKIAFALVPDDGGDFAKAETRAIRFARDSATELYAIQRFLAGHFLDMANEDWAEPDSKRFSVKDFISRIVVETVRFKGDGSAEFVFTDSDIFSGHWLIARMRPDGILYHAELAG